MPYNPVSLIGSNVPTKLAPAPRQSKVYQRNGAIGANVEEVLVDIPGRPCHLESFAMGTDYISMGINIYAYDENNVLSLRLGLPLNDGSTVSAVLPGALDTHWSGENDFFKNFKFDDAGNKFGIGMKRQAVFNNGVRVSVKNFDTTNPHNAAVAVMVSEWRN